MAKEGTENKEKKARKKPAKKEETEEKKMEPEVIKTEETPLVVVPEEETAEILEKKEFIKDSWSPKTGLGRKVKNGEITDIDYILDRGMKILEPEIVDALLPNLKMDLIMVGQAKGKFGGGQRRVFKQTQKKTPEGNKPHFGAYVVVGNEDGYVGVGYGKAKETVPAREKAIRNAKLSVMKVRRGCGSWQCGCGNYHSIPFAVEGRCGSVRIKLIPAPKGKGLCVTRECQKILALAGIKDVWSKMIGQGRSTINLVNASMAALHNLTAMKTGSMASNRNKFIEGKIKGEEKPSAEINAGEGEEQ